MKFAHGDGSASFGFIDCCQRSRFVLAAKKAKAPGHTKGFDDALLRARAQAEGYARALPPTEAKTPVTGACKRSEGPYLIPGRRRP